MVNSRTSTERYTAVLYGLALAIVCWSGPRPLVHSHLQLIGSPQGIQVLQQHLRLCHVHEDHVVGIADDGLHCHWILFAEVGCHTATEISHHGVAIESTSASIVLDELNRIDESCWAAVNLAQEVRSTAYPKDSANRLQRSLPSGATAQNFYCVITC